MNAVFADTFIAMRRLLLSLARRLSLPSINDLKLDIIRLIRRDRVFQLIDLGGAVIDLHVEQDQTLSAFA